MKWINKGHEFDELGQFFKQIEEILFVGDEDEFSSFQTKIAFLSIEPVHYNFEEYKINKNFSKKLLSKIKKAIYINNFAHKLKNLLKKSNNKLVIFSEKSGHLINKIVNNNLFIKNKNIFMQKDFELKYLPVYALYAKNKMYSAYSTCLVVTTKCTLNCKYCLNYQPYIKEKQHYEIKNLIKDIDLFFKQFDYVDYFSLTGGEPLLWKDFAKLINYIGENYRSKIGELWFATNGTLIPGDELCETIKKYDVLVLCDNYTKYVPKIKETYNKMVEKFKSYNIRTQESTEDLKFFKTFPPSEDYTKWNDDKMIDKFNLCKEQYSGFGLSNGKLYQCCYSLFANTADIVKEIPSDFVNLEDVSKRELLEFILGYTENGYCHFCQYCNCFYGIHNGGYDEGGVTQQPINEPLSFDINNYKLLNAEVEKCQK